jgi:hypothetical protein
MPTPREKAEFVFRGTVLATGQATMAHVEATERTAIVRVDEVLRAPEALRLATGQSVTVVGEDVPPPAGQQAVFFTFGMIFGATIAVHSLGHDDVLAADNEARASASPADPVDQHKAQRADDRFATADLVVTGQVRSVRMLDGGPIPAAAALGNSELPRRVSEHEPLWQEATIDVHEVHKGAPPSGPVVVRFPASMDVMWFRAPKFRAGQAGVFLLHRGDEEAPEGLHATAAVLGDTGQEGDTFTALDPADFHPAGDTAAVDAVLANANSEH